MNFLYEEMKTPLNEKMRLQTSRQYCDGMLKITPSECILPTKYRDWAKRINEFLVRDDDVWIVTYPKCGTTWTQEMVWLIMHDLDFDGAREHLMKRSPFFEFWACAPEGEEKEFGLEDTIKFTEELKSPRCVKSHLPKDLLPNQLWTKKPKIIYVTRSVKDVVVSFYHHHKIMNAYTGSLDEFLEYFMDEQVLAWDPFWRHVLDFWKMKDEPNILINSYEEMKNDLPRVIRRTAKFLGKSLSEEQVARLTEHLQFSNMKNNKAVNFEDITKLLEEKHKVSGKFMRKGEVGSGVRELTQGQVDCLDKWSKKRIAGTDYPFVG